MKKILQNNNLINIETNSLLFLYHHSFLNEEMKRVIITELINRYFNENRKFNLYFLLNNDLDLFYDLAILELKTEKVLIPEEHSQCFFECLLSLIKLIKDKLKNNNQDMIWSFESLIGFEDILNKFKKAKIKKPELSRKINLLIEEINIARKNLKEELILLEAKNKKEITLTNNLLTKELLLLKIPVSQLKQKDWEKAIENINLYELDIQKKLIARAKSFNDFSILEKSASHVLGIVLTNIEYFTQKKTFLIDILTFFKRANIDILEKYMPLKEIYFSLLKIANSTRTKLGVVLYRGIFEHDSFKFEGNIQKKYYIEYQKYLLKIFIQKTPTTNPSFLFFKEKYYSIIYNSMVAIKNSSKDCSSKTIFNLSLKKRKNISFHFSLKLQLFYIHKNIYLQGSLFLNLCDMINTVILEEKISLNEQDKHVFDDKYYSLYLDFIKIIQNIVFSHNYFNKNANEFGFENDKEIEKYTKILCFKIINNLMKEEEYISLLRSPYIINRSDTSSSLLKKAQDHISNYLSVNKFKAYDFKNISHLAILLKSKLIEHNLFLMKELCLELGNIFPDDLKLVQQCLLIKNENKFYSEIIKYFEQKLLKT